MKRALAGILLAGCSTVDPPPILPIAAVAPVERAAVTAPAPSAAALAVPVPRAKSAPLCVIPRSIDTVAERQRGGIFDGFSLDGARIASHLVTATGKVLLVNETDGDRLVSRIELDPRAIAWSFGGGRQVLLDGGRVLVEDGAGAPAPLAGAEVPDEQGASMSDDGRFLVLASEPALYDLTAKKKLDLSDAPKAAGGSEPYYGIDASGRVLRTGNSRTSALGRVTFEPAFAVAWEPSSSGAIPSRDASVLLSVPVLPFALEWEPTFHVRGKVSVQLPLSLTEQDAFKADLCPGGNLVVVVAKGALRFYRADTGKAVWSKPLAEVSSARPNALTEAKGAPDVLRLSPAGDLLFVKTGTRELLLRLVP